jgi:hypothetical protein
MALEPHTGACPVCDSIVNGARDTNNGVFLPKRGHGHRYDCAYGVVIVDDITRIVDAVADGGGDAADRGRRVRVADLAWRLRMWADECDRYQPSEAGEARAYKRAADEVERVGSMCWSGFDVEADRRPAPMIR